MYKRQTIQTKMEIKKCSGQRMKLENQTVRKFTKSGYKNVWMFFFSVVRCSLPPYHCGALCQGLSNLTGPCLALVRWTVTTFRLPSPLDSLVTTASYGLVWLNHVATRNTLHGWLAWLAKLFVHFSSLWWNVRTGDAGVWHLLSLCAVAQWCFVCVLLWWKKLGLN